MNCMESMARPEGPPPAPMQRDLILVVDSDTQARERLCAYLARRGYRTRAAAHEHEMWASLKDTNLVILDQMLPGEGGLAVCRALRRKGDWPIIMTGTHGDAEERIIGLELGADDYLSKPFDPRELLARIRAIHRRLRPAPPCARPPGDISAAGAWR